MPALHTIARRRYRGAIGAVILDWAGTAVDYGSFAPIAVFLRLFADQGVVITPEDARAGMGLMKKDHLRTILARPTVRSAWQSVHGAPPSEPDIDDLFEQFIPLQTAVLKEHAKPIPGVIEATAELRKRGIKIGSTTGYLRAMMATLAPTAAAHGYRPDCIVCSDDVPAGRPAPWMCFMNAMRLGVYPMAALIKLSGIVLLLPTFAFFIQSPWELAFGLLPTYWLMKVYWLLESGQSDVWMYALVALIYQSVGIGALVRRFDAVMHR